MVADVFFVEELNRLLDIKQRLLMVALKEGTILSRDDSEFVACMRSAELAVGQIQDSAQRENARRILAHIRQFNPFNSSDVDENDLLTEVVEDFLSFSRSRIEKLSA